MAREQEIDARMIPVPMEMLLELSWDRRRNRQTD